MAVAPNLWFLFVCAATVPCCLRFARPVIPCLLITQTLPSLPQEAPLYRSPHVNQPLLPFLSRAISRASCGLYVTRRLLLPSLEVPFMPAARLFCPPSPSDRSFFAPWRQFQGAIGLFSRHSPNLSALAALSAFRKSFAKRQNPLYHHAAPSRTILKFILSPPSPSICPKVLPYFSGPMPVTRISCLVTNPPSLFRLSLKYNCPCSGASIPHNRIISTSPPSDRNLMVSPSYTNSTFQELPLKCTL